MHVVAVNAQCRAGTEDGIRCLIDCASQICSNWKILMVTECDNVRSTTCNILVPAGFCSTRVWPGDGCNAFRLVWRECLDVLPESVRTCGRSGILTFCTGWVTRAERQSQFSIAVVHGSHDALEESLADLSTLLPKQHSLHKFLIVGDWNVDQLPTLAGDPWKNLPQRSSHHLERRVVLESFLKAHSLELCLPECSRGVPDSFFDDECLGAPISRVPSELQHRTLGHLPSLLDYGAKSKHVSTRCSIVWDARVGDHAWEVFDVDCKAQIRHFYKSRWECRDRNAFVHACHSFSFPSASQVCPIDFLKPFQVLVSEFQDKTTCRDKHQRRMPLQLRNTYRQIASSTTECEKKRLRDLAWQQRKVWLRELHVASVRCRMDRGHVFARSKKLFPIQVLVLTNGDRCTCPSTQCHEAALFFAQKLGHDDVRARSRVVDFVCSAESVLPSFNEVDVEVCLSRMKRKCKLDADGCCIDALSMYFFTNPHFFTNWLRQLCASTGAMSALSTRGKFMGKVSSTSEMGKLRAIFPQSSLVGLIDSLLARCLEHQVDRIIAITPGLFFGAHRYTQALDISHAANLVIENGIDSWGEGAWGQMDIRSYYDEIPILSVAEFLLSKGANLADVAAAVRHQLLITLEFEHRGFCSQLPTRSRGGITGSRIASVLQRVPVESTLLDCKPLLLDCSFRCGPARFCAASYIDNIYFPSRFGDGVIKNATIVEEALLSNWGLHIKPGSKTLTLSKGQDVDFDVPTDWILEATTNVLGRLVSEDNSIHESWKCLRTKMWKVFYANVRARHWKLFGFQRRLKLLDRAIGPLVRFHSASWPPQNGVKVELDKLHRRMVAMALNLPWYPLDTIQMYRRRVSRESNKHICKLWSQTWFENAVEWKLHLERDWRQQVNFFNDNVDPTKLSTCFAWAPVLFNHVGSSWIQQHRTFHPTNNHVVTRVHRRRCTGKVHPRWAESVARAAEGTL